MRFALIILATLLLVPRLAAGDESEAAKQYAMLLAEFETEGGVRPFAKRFLAFAEQHVGDPAAADALLWVVDNVRGRAETSQAIALLKTHHIGSPKMGAGSQMLASARTVGAETLLRAIIDHNDNKQIQAQACYGLAQLLDREADIIEQLRANPELAPRVLQYYGKEYGDHLASLKPATLAEQREALYEKMLASYADIELENQKLGNVATTALFALRHLAVGKVAPEIQGIDLNGVNFKLSDYRGKVVMLSFWAHW